MVAGQDNAESPTRPRSPAQTLNTVADEASHPKILKLLRVAHKLNGQITDGDIIDAHALPETAFIDNRLTVKLTRQLEEPMIVARLVILSTKDNSTLTSLAPV